MGARVLVYVDDSSIPMQRNDGGCVLAHRARLNKEENNISQDKDEETIELENGEIITPPLLPRELVKAPTTTPFISACPVLIWGWHGVDDEREGDCHCCSDKNQTIELPNTSCFD